MQKRTFDQQRVSKNWLQLFLLIIIALSGTGCIGISNKSRVPVVLSPLTNSDKTSLTAQINRYASVKTIRGKVDVKFEDNSFAESGISEKYRSADGQVVVQTPSNINLRIQIPFVGTDLVQMTSDGEKFRVAVICCVEERYKRFVTGTNAADYSRLQEKAQTVMSKRNAESQAISVFASLRPQHFTDALLIRPIKPSNDFVYTQSEIYQEEEDPTRQKSRISRVIRGYYLLDEYKKTSDDDFQITRRFWFDRIGGIRLARQQIFNNQGVLETDITYGAEQQFTDNGQYNLPGQVQITRPQEHYSVRLTFQTPNAVVIGKTYEQQVFKLENQWQLPEVDLDKQAADQSRLFNQ